MDQLNLTADHAAIAVFYLEGENEDGENVDLFVCAPSATEALDIWRDNFVLASDFAPNKIGKLPGVLAGKVGALCWSEIQDPALLSVG